MSAAIKTCPFCDCAMTISSNRDWHRLVGDHDDACFFAVDADMLIAPATEDQLAVLVSDWNRRAALAAKTEWVADQDMPTYAELEALYNAQCECTDQWAEKYIALVNNTADATFKARVTELERMLAAVNGRLSEANAALQAAPAVQQGGEAAQIPRKALSEFCKKYCLGMSELVATAESAFYAFNQALAVSHPLMDDKNDSTKAKP